MNCLKGGFALSEQNMASPTPPELRLLDLVGLIDVCDALLYIIINTRSKVRRQRRIARLKVALYELSQSPYCNCHPPTTKAVSISGIPNVYLNWCESLTWMCKVCGEKGCNQCMILTDQGTYHHQCRSAQIFNNVGPPGI